MKFCTNCGLKLAQSVKTCPRCGAVVPDSSMNVSPSSTSETPADVGTQSTKAAFSQESSDSIPQNYSFHQEFTVAANASPEQSDESAHNHPAEQFNAQQPLYLPSQPQASQPSQTPQAFQPSTPALNPPQFGGYQQPEQSAQSAQSQQSPFYLQAPPQYSGAHQANYQNLQQAPTYGAPHSAPPASYTQPPRKRQGISRGIVALIIILALILVSSGVGLIYYSTVTRPAQLKAQATATAQVMGTNEANATDVANTQATGTAIAYANATVTVQAQATTQAQATVTALQNIYTQATQGTPALSSPLNAQDNNNWDVNDTTDGGGCGFNAGSYHDTLFSKNFYFPCFAQASNFSDFAYQVQMKINEGDEGGLIFRSNSDTTLSQYYLLNVSQTGEYALIVSKDNTHNTTLAEGTSGAIKKGAGQLNTIAIVAKGSSFYIYINKQYIGSASDSTYSSGVLGVFASDITSNTDVSFSNAQVWSL